MMYAPHSQLHVESLGGVCARFWHSKSDGNRLSQAAWRITPLGCNHNTLQQQTPEGPHVFLERLPEWGVCRSGVQDQVGKAAGPWAS